MKRIKRKRRKSQALVNDLIYFYLHFGALCKRRYEYGNIKTAARTYFEFAFYKHETTIKIWQ
jgi:hypothetical protein